MQLEFAVPAWKIWEATSKGSDFDEIIRFFVLQDGMVTWKHYKRTPSQQRPRPKLWEESNVISGMKMKSGPVPLAELNPSDLRMWPSYKPQPDREALTNRFLSLARMRPEAT